MIRNQVTRMTTKLTDLKLILLQAPRYLE